MFFAKIPRRFVWEIWKWNKALGILIYLWMKEPVKFTGTIFDAIIVVSHKEFSKFMRDGSRMNLIRMHRWIKNVLSGM